MKPKLYATRILPGNVLDKLSDYYQVKVWENEAKPPQEVLEREILDSDALISLVSDNLDSELLCKGKKLKIISQYAVGYNNVDLIESTKRGIYVTNTPDVLTNTTADYAFTLLMGIARHISEADKYVKDKNWKLDWHPNMFTGNDIYGATIGILGLGRIGKAMAKRCEGFDMEITYYDVYRDEEFEKKFNAKYKELEDLFKESDFISIHTPLNEDTYHLVSEKLLRVMKKESYIINTARGPIINHVDLYKALKNKWISGAALDVHEEEPVRDDYPLFELDNVILTPHIASASYKTRIEMANIVMNNLIQFINKEIPSTLVNKEVLDNVSPGF